MSILLAGVKGDDSLSKVLLDLIPPNYYLDKLYLEHDIVRCANQLKHQLLRRNYQTIVLFVDSVYREKLGVVLKAEKEANELVSTYPYESLITYAKEYDIAMESADKVEDDLGNSIYYFLLENQTMPDKSICILIPKSSTVSMMNLAKLWIDYTKKIYKQGN